MAPRFVPLDLQQLKVYPLAERRSMSEVEGIDVDPDSQPAPAEPQTEQHIRNCAQQIRSARARGAAVLCIYGAHLVKNGAMSLIDRLLSRDYITHLATNGAGSIHDWEFAFQGRSTESVRDNVATGTFGTWDETGRYIHLAIAAGALQGDGYGVSLGRFIHEDGVTLPPLEDLEADIRNKPLHPLTAARADLLQMMFRHQLTGGRHQVNHPWKKHSIFAQAYNYRVPLTVHPGIGYDIIANHPMFSGAVIGRGADVDFKLFSRTVDSLDGGVVLSIGSAIMGPQVFEKSISCVNNLRLQSGRPIVRDHGIYVVDLQDGGQWDWSQGEPPKDNPAYYLRFCKSFSRMGGTMHYLQCDNVQFLQLLCHALAELPPHRP